MMMRPNGQTLTELGDESEENTSATTRDVPAHG